MGVFDSDLIQIMMLGYKGTHNMSEHFIALFLTLIHFRLQFMKMVFIYVFKNGFWFYFKNHFSKNILFYLKIWLLSYGGQNLLCWTFKNNSKTKGLF